MGSSNALPPAKDSELAEKSFQGSLRGVCFRRFVNYWALFRQLGAHLWLLQAMRRNNSIDCDEDISRIVSIVFVSY